MIRTLQRLILVSDGRLVRFGIVAVLMVVLVGLAFVTLRLGPTVTPALAAAPLLLLLALSRLEYGPVVILFAAAFVRFALPTGTQSEIVASMALTGILIAVWLLKMVAVEKRLHLEPAATNVPLLGFIVAVLFSYLWGNAFRDPLVVTWSTWPFVQLGALAEMVLLPGAFLLTANTVRSTRLLKAITVLMSGAGALYLSGFLIMMGVPSQRETMRALISQFNSGGMFSMWFGLLIYTQILFNKRLPQWLRLGLVGLLVVWVYRFFVVGVTWMAGWFVPAVAFMAVSFLRSKRFFLVLLLLLAIYLALNWNYLVGVVAAREASESGYTRLRAYQQNWQVTQYHFLFGMGPVGYAVYYMTYFPNVAMASHSDYIDVLAQTGVVGLALYLAFFGALLWTAYGLVRRLRGRSDFVEAYANALFAGGVGCVVAMGLGTWLIPFIYTASLAGFDHAVYSWLLLGTTVALRRIVVPTIDADGSGESALG